MLEKWKVSTNQFRNLIILYFIGTTILYIPGSMTAVAKQDAWISIILGTAAGSLIVLLYNAVGNLFPRLTLAQCAEKLLGKWLGKAVMLWFVSFSFFSSSAIVWYVGNFFTTSTPEISIITVNTFFLLIVVMGVYLGLEVLARTSEILFHWVIFFFIMLIGFNLPNIRFSNIQPIFENGLKEISHGALSYMCYSYLPLINLLMFFPAFLDKPQEAKKTWLTGTLIGSLIIFILVTVCIMVMGSDFTALHTFSSYTLAKQIKLGNYIERIEAVLAITWVITLFFKVCFYHFASILALAQIFELKDYHPIVLPLSMTSITLSFVIYPNIVYERNWDNTTWISYVLTVGFFLPILLLVVGFFRGVTGSNKCKEKGSS